MKLGKDLVAASAVPLILAILEEGESYGYAIIARVRELSDGKMRWTDGMLYPVLHRLEAQGAIRARWKVLSRDVGESITRSTAKDEKRSKSTKRSGKSSTAPSHRSGDKGELKSRKG